MSHVDAIIAAAELRYREGLPVADVVLSEPDYRLALAEAGERATDVYFGSSPRLPGWTCEGFVLQGPGGPIQVRRA